MIAAGRLQALIESRASGTSVVRLIAQLDRIIRAIHDSVPEELWEEILHKIDGPVLADIPRMTSMTATRRVSKPATLWGSAIQFNRHVG